MQLKLLHGHLPLLAVIPAPGVAVAAPARGDLVLLLYYRDSAGRSPLMSQGYLFGAAGKERELEGERKEDGGKVKSAGRGEKLIAGRHHATAFGQRTQ